MWWSQFCGRTLTDALQDIEQVGPSYVVTVLGAFRKKSKSAYITHTHGMAFYSLVERTLVEMIVVVKSLVMLVVTTDVDAGSVLVSML